MPIPRVSCLLIGLLSACGAAHRASALPEGLDGTWWLADSEAGPMRARLEIEDGALALFATSAADVATRWVVSPDGAAWEARGPEGATLVLDDRGANSIIVQSGDQIGLAWRTENLPATLAGAWRWRLPDGRDLGITLLGGPAGQPARAVLEAGVTGNVWALRGGEGALSLVIQVAGAPTELWHLHRRGDAWLTWTGTSARAGTLYRSGRAPSWVPVTP